MPTFENSNFLDTIERVKRITESIEWIVNQLITFEKKYKIRTIEFIIKWRSGNIPKPEDENTLREMLSWNGLYDLLERKLRELKEVVGNLKYSENSE